MPGYDGRARRHRAGRAYNERVNHVGDVLPPPPRHGGDHLAQDPGRPGYSTKKIVTRSARVWIWRSDQPGVLAGVMEGATPHAESVSQLAN